MVALWHIYHVKNCRHAKPDPKDKFVVIVCKDVQAMGFFINTEINSYIKNRPELLACQVLIQASDHKCLDWNSYVDCHELFRFEDAELSIRNPVAKQTREAIKNAVNISELLVERYRKLILGEPKPSPKSS
jgi:hypothetical protein